MSLDSNVTGPTAVELFWKVPQPDDAGAQTADRFDWQAAMATGDGLALYEKALDSSGHLPEGNDCRIVCERHEDWALVVGDAVELVSAKHRDSSYGAYTTVNQLAGDGGVAHLFNRWHALDEKPTCRLVTTPGLADSARDLANAIQGLRQLRLAELPLAIAEKHRKPIADLCRSIRQHSKPKSLPAAWVQNSDPHNPTEAEQEQSARFLSMLDIEHTSLPRDFAPYAAANMYAKPLLERLGVDVPPDAIWQATHDLMRVRMRAAGPVPRGKLPAVLAYTPGASLPTIADLERADISRIVTMLDIDIVVKTAIAHPGGFRPLIRKPRLSRLAVKMAAGHCTDNSVERAEELRREYLDYWRQRLSGDPAARVEQARLRRRLHRISDEATTATSTAALQGRALWGEVQSRLEEFPESDIPAGMDSDLLLGGVCDLTSECKVWFSERFDVETEISRLRDERGQAS
ncbi:hypothetical protein [Streptomyces apricus]|uniref:Uncharacterized protein n=1 Tax=Streptomyces apricus TaxID=1828112 RepID=A0A5B0APX8_9ACTN|nr:hypothetical protein [Streptomyces apricus]KAA0930579.1 hypothetical protein FGF04_28980 [Streptomyces apricus]